MTARTMAELVGGPRDGDLLPFADGTIWVLLPDLSGFYVWNGARRHGRPLLEFRCTPTPPPEEDTDDRCP